MKKPSTTTAKKPMSKTDAAQAVAEAKPKKVGSTVKKTAPKSSAATVKSSTPKPELAVSERVGLTAGSIWNYLNANGATAVAKLAKELPEDEKIIQRSIGWLAQEGKLSFNMIDKLETISLKG